MMIHPFEIKPSASAATPDELMVTWGDTPAESVASMYLPAVTSTEIIALANASHRVHRITAVDAHTIEFPSGDMTLVPVPPGRGRYAGLLSITLPVKAPTGQIYTVAVRQFTQLGATVDRASFTWRQLAGAFQCTLTVSTNEEAIYPQERLLAWLKWRLGVTPSSSRWYPVLDRYLELTERRVGELGGHPASIKPSPAGQVPGRPL
jgi:hypothetical protein